MSTLASVVLYGIYSALPSAGIPGRIYYTSDTEQIYRDNGTTWDNVTPVASSTSIIAIQQESYIFAVDTGAANAYVVALSPSPTIVAGSVIVMQAVHANTGASTVAVNGTPSVPITKQGATALSGGEISANQIVLLIYDGTQYQLVTTGGGGSSGTKVSEAPSGTIPGNVFTTTGTPAFVWGLYVNGQFWSPSNYTVSGTTVTLATSLSLGDEIWIVYTT